MSTNSKYDKFKEAHIETDCNQSIKKKRERENLKSSKR